MTTILILNLALAFWIAPAFAHPGRLDDKGCHEVNEDWIYTDGRVLKAGTEHCHRGLGAMPLDSKEMLQDHADPGRSVKEMKQQARDNACAKAALDVLIDHNRVMDRVNAGDMLPLREFAAIHKRTKAVLKECGAK